MGGGGGGVSTVFAKQASKKKMKKKKMIYARCAPTGPAANRFELDRAASLIEKNLEHCHADFAYCKVRAAHGVVPLFLQDLENKLEIRTCKGNCIHPEIERPKSGHELRLLHKSGEKKLGSTEI